MITRFERKILTVFIALLMIFSTCTVNVNAESYTVIDFGQTVTSKFTGDEMLYYQITPTRTDNYQFNITVIDGYENNIEYYSVAEKDMVYFINNGDKMLLKQGNTYIFCVSGYDGCEYQWNLKSDSYNDPITVHLDQDISTFISTDRYSRYKFTPNTTGYYDFYCTSYADDQSLNFELYDDDWNYLDSDEVYNMFKGYPDINYIDTNKYGTIKLIANQTYNFVIRNSQERWSNFEPSIAKWKIRKSSDFKYSKNGDKTIAITQYLGDSKNVTIPSTIDGKTVTEIGGLDLDDNVTSITIPNTVTNLQYHAIAYTKNLTSIQFASNSKLKTIESFAIVGNEKLAEFTIPDGAKAIGYKAFSSNNNLKKLVIPASVSSIKDLEIGIWSDGKNEGIKTHNISGVSVYGYYGSQAYKFFKNNKDYSHVSFKLLNTLSLNYTSKTLNKGSSFMLKATATPSATVTYKSSNAKVATVASNGTVKGINPGKTTITASSNGISKTCIVTVPYTITYKLNGGTNNKSNPSTYYGKKITLKNPTRKGYTFSGWYSDSKFKTKVTSFSSGNKTLYAKWTKVSVAKAKTPTLTNVSGKKLKISYSATSGAKGYQIQYATNSKFSNPTTKTLTGRSATYTLTKGKTYYVRVRAYKIDSTGAKVYGSWSAVKSKKITK